MEIDPSYLAELSVLSFRIKRKIFGKYSGDERTHQTGDGLTFKDHAQYVLGDDVRKIDWNVYARTQQLYVKKYQADRNLTLHVLLDASASMNYGEGDTNKFKHSAKLALAIAYVLSQHQGRTRFATFSDRLHHAKAMSGSSTLPAMLNTLKQTSIAGMTNIAESLMEYRKQILRGKSGIVLFSDFLCPPDHLEDVLTHFPRTQIVLVQIAHPDELNINLYGDFKVTDAEDNSVQNVHISPRFISEYRERMKQHLAHLETFARKYNISFVQLDTSATVFENFVRLWEVL